LQKKKEYPGVKFSARAIRAAIDKCNELVGKKATRPSFNVTVADESWEFDDLDEFLTAYSNESVLTSDFGIWWPDNEMLFGIYMDRTYTAVRVRHAARAPIEAVFSIFEEAPPADRISLPPSANAADVTVFIGHGRNKQWEDLKQHLQDKHQLQVVSYETGARAGHTIRDVLDSMAKESSIALLVLTGEDKTQEGLIRARQNVIHECGLFQGRLGFDRAILLVEQGVELASNFDGVQQLRFKKGPISGVFGDVLATIKREFGSI
jgi:predicted nucleotide-binding protein